MLGFSPLASSALSDRGVRILDASASASCTSSVTSAGQRIALGASLNAFDPERGLTLDYEFSEADLSGSTINTPEYSGNWPDRDKNLVMGFETTLPSSFSDTIDGFLTIGGTGTGTWAGVITDTDGQKKYWVTSGQGQNNSGFKSLSDAAADRVSVSDIPEFDGNSHTVVIDIRINPGRIRSWIDGRLVLEGSTTGGGQLENGLHSGSFSENFGNYAFCRSVADIGTWSGTIGSDLRVYTDELVGDNDSSASQAFTKVESQRVREADSTIACTGSVTSEGTRVREASATVTASSTVTMTSGSVLRSITAQDINAVATITSEAERVQFSASNLASVSSVTAVGRYTAKGEADIDATASTSGVGERIHLASCQADSTTVTITVGRKKWEAIADTGQSYNSQQLDSQSWNQKTQTSQDYVQIGDDSQNWSTISKTSANWSDIAA